MEAQNRAVEAQNGVIVAKNGAVEAQKWSGGGSKMERWRLKNGAVEGRRFASF
jgi:hypothetical protein